MLFTVQYRKILYYVKWRWDFTRPIKRLVFFVVNF